MSGRSLTREEFATVSHASIDLVETMRAHIQKLSLPDRSTFERLTRYAVLNQLRKAYISVQRAGGDSYGFISLEELYKLIEGIENKEIDPLLLI